MTNSRRGSGENRRIEHRGLLKLVLVAALVGIPAAFAAAIFLGFVHILEHWLWTDLPGRLGYASPPWYLVLGLPAAGAVIVLLARLLLPGDGGAPPLEGLHEGVTPIAHAPGIVVAALGTLGFGAVLGPEAPVIAIGSVIGLAAMYVVPLAERERAIIAGAGSFSAVSALFGGPVVGGVMMVESGVGLGEAVIAALLPGFVAAGIGYVIFVGLGNWAGLNAPGLAVPNLPAYQGTHVYELLLAVAVGIVAALVLTQTRRLALAFTKAGEHLSLPVLLVGGGLAIGAIALLARALGDNSQDVLFSGQASIPALIAEDSTKLLLIVLVAKIVAYAISLSCGFRGGPIFPAIFVGIGLATFPVVWFGTSPTAAIAIGAAAGMAAQTRLLLTAILFGSLLVGGVGLDAVPAAVLAACAAWLTASALAGRPG
jgi:chloride channel protein, CIC family